MFFKNGRINAAALASSIKAADIRFESFSLKHTDERFNISNVSGIYMASENLWADNLAFTFCGATFLLNGNLPVFPPGSRKAGTS
jgi:hypothetical protein